jgi:tetratricopeptide (TPR) repeat protein
MNPTLQALETQLGQTQALSEKLGLLDQLYQFLRISDLRRAKETVEDMLILSQNPAYPAGRGLALKNMGDFHFRQGNLPAAQGCLEEALSILRVASEARGEVDTLNALGNFYYFQGGFPRALEYYLQALEQSRKYNFDTPTPRHGVSGSRWDSWFDEDCLRCVGFSSDPTLANHEKLLIAADAQRSRAP